LLDRLVEASMGFKAVRGGVAEILVAGILMVTAPAVTAPARAEQAGDAPNRPAPAPVQMPVPSAQWRDQALPLLAQIIRQKSQLALSPAQLETIERLSLDFAREAIRRQAEWQIAMIDLATMLESDPADPAKPLDLPRLEAKIREVSAIGGEIEMMRLRAIETGKAQLRPEQRAKLVNALNENRADPPEPPEIGARSAPGGAGVRSHPGGGGPRPPGFPPGHFPGHPPGIHGGVPGRGFVGVWPGWPWYGWWWGYPGPVYAPPPAPAYWYYCPAYGEYYPNVPTCPEPWVPVPAG
jgi:hypothetical protein